MAVSQYYKICPGCGQHAALEAQACDGCGHRYRTTFTKEGLKICPACAQPTAPNVQVCGHCGQDFHLPISFLSPRACPSTSPLPAFAASRLQERLPSPESAGAVYLLRAGPYYKIGKAKRFDRRLREIKLQLPFPVEKVHVITTPDCNRVEAYWHKRFGTKRCNGEWFELTESQVREFKEFRSM